MKKYPKELMNSMDFWENDENSWEELMELPRSKIRVYDGVNLYGIYQAKYSKKKDMVVLYVSPTTRIKDDRMGEK